MYPSVTYRLASLLGLLGLLSGCAAYDRVFHPHRLGSPPMTASAKARAKAADKARHKGTTLAAIAAADETKTGAAAAGGDASADTPAAPDEAKSAADKNKAIEDMLGNTYNTKTGLLKRNALQRFQNNSRKLHHYDLSAPLHTDATRDARHLRKHPKGTGKAKEEKDTDTPAKEAAEVAADPNFTPDPTQPAAPKATRPAETPAPTAAKAPASKAAKASAPKAAKAEARSKVKVDKAKEARIKEDKLRNGGERVEKPAKPRKDKNAPKAPKPDPTQPLTGQD